MYPIDKKKSLFILIKNSLGTKLFQSLYFFKDGKSRDIYRKGDLSCAFYVSTILKIIGMIGNIHAEIKSTIKDLEESGWYKIDKLKRGSVIIWEAGKHGHRHIGFYLGKNKAVSNSPKTRTPTIHSVNYENRKIEAIYFHKDLE